MTKKPIISLTIALLLLIAIGAALILADPFDWRVGQRLQGGGDAALAAMPADSQLVIGVDLLQAADEETRAMANTFLATGGSDGLLAALAARSGLDLPGDVSGWIGQYAGLAILAVESDTFNEVTDVRWVAALETRSTRQADEFLQKLASGWAAQNGLTAVTTAHNGVTITAFAADAMTQRLALARADNLVLLGDAAPSIAAAIDAANGESLLDTAVYQELAPRLTPERPATVYIDSAAALELLPRLLGDGLPFVLPTIPRDGMRGTLAAVTVQGSQIRSDAYTAYHLSALHPAQRQLVETMASADNTAVTLPPQTLLYANGRGVNLLWELYKAAYSSEAGDAALTDTLDLLEQALGFNPDTALLPYLDGSAAVGLWPGQSGLVRQLETAQLQMALTVSSTQPAQLTDAVGALTQSMIGGPLPLARGTESSTADGQTIYEVESFLFPGTVVPYGTAAGQLFVGTTATAVDQLVFDGSASLAAQPDFQAAFAPFAADMTPMLYVDVDGLVTHLQPTGVLPAWLAARTAVLQPINSLSATTALQDGVTYTQAILFVEQ